jgi:hypothetical protein
LDLHDYRALDASACEGCMNWRKAKFQKVTDGEWVRPTRRGYLMKCCDCGLVHLMNFRVIKYGRRTKIFFQAFRLNKGRVKRTHG